MPNPVIHWEIGATDLERSRAFYAELFDWEITPGGPDYLMVGGASPGIGGGILQTPEHVPPYLTFYVQVPQLEEALGRAVELGAKEVVAPMVIPGVGRFAMFEDPDTHVVGLLEPAAEDAPGPPATEA